MKNMPGFVKLEAKKQRPQKTKRLQQEKEAAANVQGGKIGKEKADLEKHRLNQEQ